MKDDASTVGNGDESAHFYGPHSDERAREYATWIMGSTEKPSLLSGITEFIGPRAIERAREYAHWKNSAMQGGGAPMSEHAQLDAQMRIDMARIGQEEQIARACYEACREAFEVQKPWSELPWIDRVTWKARALAAVAMAVDVGFARPCEVLNP